MLTKRIIPCLDVKDGKTVKGVNFVDIKNVGDPVELGKKYASLGADELVFLDITATHEKRKTMADLVSKIAMNVNIPFTVGGGISSKEDVSVLLNSGADKIAVNSAAVKNPDLINELSATFGSQCIVLAVDAKFDNGNWFVHLNGGRIATDIDVKNWCLEAEKRGAGEILLTSMDHDGTKDGFAISLTNEISTSLNIPVIASGGAGKKEHFLEVFQQGNADAALAASVFHYGEINIKELKEYLLKEHLPIRL